MSKGIGGMTLMGEK